MSMVSCGLDTTSTSNIRYIPFLSSASSAISCNLDTLTFHGCFHHVCRNQIHAVWHKVARRFIAAQTVHVRDHLLAEPVHLDFCGTCGTEQHNSASTQREREMHG